MSNLQLTPVTKEIAIRLKEKGFDLINYNADPECISAPSLDLALLWLEGKGFEFYTVRISDGLYQVLVTHKICDDSKILLRYNSTKFKEVQILMALDILDSETKK